MNFLRREGARLNPYQVSLIHEIPYQARSGASHGGSRQLSARMRTVLKNGAAADPGQPDGIRRTRLSTLIRDKKAATSVSEGTPENSGEDTGN